MYILSFVHRILYVLTVLVNSLKKYLFFCFSNRKKDSKGENNWFVWMGACPVGIKCLERELLIMHENDIY